MRFWKPFLDGRTLAVLVPASGMPEAAGDPRPPANTRRAATRYLLSAFLLAVAGLGLIAQANRRYAPEMYEPSRLGLIADALSNGQGYAVFDLNIDMRTLRHEQISRLSLKPDIVILGASQWQEAATGLLGHRHVLNAHIHGDYYDDVLGMVEMLVRNDRLPRDLVITVRDRLFTPVDQRTDFLWLAGLPSYQAMARRLSLETHPFLDTRPLQRPRELLSLGMLAHNAARRHTAGERPQPTTLEQHQKLDILMPDGSIRWSKEHKALFTPERARKLARAQAEASRNRPPRIDPRGFEAVDTLLAYLAVRGVRAHLAHPPFNPEFFDRVRDTPYMAGLSEVEAVTRELAAKHKLGIVGSFDPASLGCSASMFIDAEHAGGACLARLMAEVAASIGPSVRALPVEQAEEMPGAEAPPSGGAPASPATARPVAAWVGDQPAAYR